MKNALNSYTNLGKEFYGELCSILMFEIAINNEDEHFGNFGLLRNNDTGKIIEPAPIIDNSLSLINFAMMEDLGNLNQFKKAEIPHYGISFFEMYKAVMGSKQNFPLRKLSNCTFTRHPSIILPEERLISIEKHIGLRAREFISIPNDKNSQ